MAGNAVVVIPVYKEAVSPQEAFAIGRSLQVLDSRPVILAAPHSLDCRNYQVFRNDIGIERFPDHCFTNINSYSKLCLSEGFYKPFASWEYMLLYQPDALIFTDALDYWTSQGIDFAGGAVCKSDEHGRFVRWVRSQNGGLSLRNIESCIRVLRSQHRANVATELQRIRQDMDNARPDEELTPIYRLSSYVKRVLKGRKETASTFISRQFDRGCGIAEDQFWSRLAELFDPEFRVASLSQSCHFGIQDGITVNIEQLALKLPIGCHGPAILNRMYDFAVKEARPTSEFDDCVWRVAQRAGVIESCSAMNNASRASDPDN